MCLGNNIHTFCIYIQFILEVPEPWTSRQLLFLRMIRMIMHVYIIEINTCFIEVEALKLINFLQENIFPILHLIANSVANVHLRHSPKCWQICKFYNSTLKIIQRCIAYKYYEWAIKNIWNNMSFGLRQRLATGSSRMMPKWLNIS